MSGAVQAPAEGPVRPAAGATAQVGLWRTVGAVLRKELLVELRTLESVPAMTLFSLTTFVVFHFALNRSSVEGDLAAGILWVTLLFASILGVNRLFVADAEEGGFDAFLLAPGGPERHVHREGPDAAGLPVALEIVAVPAFALLLLGPPLGPALPGLVLTLAAGRHRRRRDRHDGRRHGRANPRAGPARAAAGAAPVRPDRDRRRPCERAAARALACHLARRRAGWRRSGSMISCSG